MGPIDGGERATAELVSIRTELLSEEDAARKRLICSCAFYRGDKREGRTVRGCKMAQWIDVEVWGVCELKTIAATTSMGVDQAAKSCRKWVFGKWEATVFKTRKLVPLKLIDGLRLFIMSADRKRVAGNRPAKEAWKKAFQHDDIRCFAYWGYQLLIALLDTREPNNQSYRVAT